MGEEAKRAGGAKYQREEGDKIGQGGKLGDSITNGTAGTSWEATDL